jgi:hypothetical protein
VCVFMSTRRLRESACLCVCIHVHETKRESICVCVCMNHVVHRCAWAGSIEGHNSAPFIIAHVCARALSNTSCSRACALLVALERSPALALVRNDISAGSVCNEDVSRTAG